MALPSQACRLYFRHVHHTCNARACCHHEARSTANTWAHTTTGCSSWPHLWYSNSSLAGMWTYRSPSTSRSNWHRIDPEGSLYTPVDDIHLSTLCYLPCRKCNALARRLGEHRTPCNSRQTIRQDRSYFRQAHSCNARCRHRRDEYSALYTRYQTTTVDSPSCHHLVCI